MGSGASSLPETSDKIPYAMLTYHWVDIIRLIHCNKRMQLIVKKCVQHYWPHGLSAQIMTKGALDIELNSRPFVRGANRSDMVNSKVMSCAILECFMAEGWFLIITADMSRIIDQSTLVFQHLPERKVPAGSKMAEIMCFSITGTEDLQLVKASKEIFETVKESIRKNYKPGLIAEHEYADNSYVLRLKEHPWTSEGEIGMEARRMFTDVCTRFAKLGYHLYGTAGFHDTADCVYFVHHPSNNGWVKDTEHVFGMISLNDNDKIRFVNIDKTARQAARTAIVQARGADSIQEEKENKHTFEYKLKGNPWAAEAQDTVVSRYTIVRILEVLTEHGWHMATTVDMSRKMNDKAVIVLKKGVPSKKHIWCLQPGEKDKLRVVNAPDAVIGTLRDTIVAHYPNGIQSEMDDFYGAFEFKLRGQPWYGRQGADELWARNLFVHIMVELDKIGWIPLVATDVSAKHIRSENGPDYPLDTASWLFVNK